MKTLYGVEYRNFRTAIHGIFVYEDIETACAVDDAWDGEDLDAMDPVTGELSPILQPENILDDYDFSEINYRDVEFDEEYGEWIYRPPLDDDIEIIVVNTLHEVPDLYGF